MPPGKGKGKRGNSREGGAIGRGKKERRNQTRKVINGNRNYFPCLVDHGIKRRVGEMKPMYS